MNIDHWLALARTPGLHADHLRDHADLLADPTALLQLSPQALQAVGLSPAAASWLTAPDAAQLATDRTWLERSGVQLLTWGSSCYPPLLSEIPSAPLVLFVRGSAECLLTLQLAMVGSRNPTASGRRDAFEFAAALAGSGMVITSGLALGIDTASHRGALRAGRTIAVLGAGLDQIYPAENSALAEAIVTQGGALVSEFPPGTTPLRHNFPRRNRLISGLAVGTLVVEAARQSGSLITARLAGVQGRDVFALPGSIHNPLSRGCHALIRAGAQLVESTDEILAQLRIPYEKHVLVKNEEVMADTSTAPRRLDKDYKILLDALGFGPTSIDALVDRTGLSSQSLASMLLILELEGAVGLHPGGRYIRLT